MKLLNIRRVLLTSVIGTAFAGAVTSSGGCGSDSNDKSGTGGTTGSAGSSGGGATGSGGGGGQKPLKLSYTFDTATTSDSMMWKLNDYIDASPAKNLGAYSKPDAGLTLAEPPTFEWASDDSESSASSGSMKIGVTFTEYGQYVDPVINISPTIDLTNSTLAMKVRLVSGSFTNGGVQFHFSTTSDYTYSAGQWIDATSFTNNSWKTTSIETISAAPATTGAPWDPTMVIQIGVQITSGSMTTTSALATGRLVFEIDTVQAR
jgi:hypothetical protein